MKKILLIMCAIAISWGSYAQDITVSGTVTSAEDGSVLPGVNVLVKGTSNGTTTDASGKYTLSVPTSAGTLVFSFIGFKSQEIEIGGRTTIDVLLALDATELSEVVVSAFGVERNTRDIVYANQTVTSEDLLTSPNKNTLEALRGKTAGVKLSTASGSVGASTRIVLRGEGSLTGNNNALIVVDGIPINNETTSGGGSTTAAAATTGYADHGNRFNDLNPDDIESVTILKGPSATSLYGSRGASGVVLITTKKGGGRRDGTLDVSLNSTFSQEKAYVLLERQNRFGQGYDNAHLDSGENWSWGPEFDGVVRPWTSPIDADGDGALESLTRPYSNVPDQLQDFFNFGSTFTNSIGISGSSGTAFSYYASYSNTNQKGILDNTYYKRNTITFNGSANLSEKFKTDFKVTYANINQNTAQEGSRAFEGNNAYAMVVQSPINIPFGEMRDYKSPFHDIDGYWGSYSSVNPYFILNEYGNEGRINNILGNTSVTYSVIEGLDLIGRFGANVINTTVDTWTPVFTPEQQLVWTDDLALTTRDTKHSSLGEYVNYFKQNINLDMSLLANYSRPLSPNLKLDVSGGYNWFQTQREDLAGSTVGGLVIDGVYNLNNSFQSPQADATRSKYRIFGVLGNARLGYKDALFLELSARNDWSSTLPTDNNSFFYSAVGVSAIVTDLLKIENQVLSFAKVRGSFGTTGKDAGLYLLNTVYNGNPQIANLNDYSIFFPLNGQPGFTTGNQIGNPTLKPELTTTLEVGADVGLFDEKINLSYTYYSSSHADQIVQISLPASSGFTSTVSNIGEMTNKGHEITLSLRPIDGLVEGLKFELFATYSKNTSEVVKITDEISELVIGGPFFPGISLIAKEGLPFGAFKGLAPKTNDAGQVIVDPVTGYPVYTDEEVYLGSYQPDFMAGLGANANYKGIGFNILFDVRQGGKFASQTKFFAEFNGSSAGSATYNREEFIWPNSVIDNGDGTFSPNDIEILEQGYYTNYDPSAATYMIDASFVKLREVGLSYTLPSKLLSKTPFKSARVALFGKNLKFWLPGDNKFADPEVNGPALTGNAQGIETTQTPSSKSFGVNLQLTF